MIKRSTEEGLELISQSPSDPILLPLESTWEDPRILTVVEVVEAAVVDTVGVEVTAAMEATATVEVVMEVEPADTAVAEEVTVEGLPHVVPLHRTIAEVEVAAAVVDDPEGTIVLVQDHTLLVAIKVGHMREADRE